ncbi:MarR family winged helix-turn-helix transcriptional regulator [Azohydromonas lata]|uniref:MarR family transcriptional regulator n=1 Tax=Azohydromonas lata TaxID=45677 RepID=A0ABU5IMG0_9BURK|nr:MarR family transcriptional regulator [Azohydromonas lata]MDZ5460060.1 MarR family transcriptional regulator [Azohydromonas lata]
MQTIDDPLRQLTRGLLRLSRGYRAAADRVAAQFGLSHATAWAVVVIHRAPEGARPGAVAEALEIEPSSLVRLMDQLVAAGLVQREDDPADRRAKRLRLTAAGLDIAQQLEDALVLLRRRLLGDVEPADLHATLRVLAALDTALAHEAGQATPADTATP